MDCEAFLARMTPLAGWLAKRRATPHPLLGQPDLFQDAMEVLLRVWRQHYPKGPEDLCRIGRVAVFRQLSTVRAHAYSRGEGEVAAWVDLDQPLSADGEGNLRIADVLGADGIEDVFFWFGLDELERSLDDLGRAVLGELLDPGERTLRAIRQVWRRRAGARGKGGNWWLKYRAAVVARGLRVPKEVVGKALRRVRREVREVFVSREPPFDRYREVRSLKGAVNRNQEGGQVMGGTPGFVPDDVSGGLPEPEKPVTGQQEAKAKKAAAQPKAAVEKKGKEKTMASKAPKKNGTVKKAVSPKAGKAAGNGRTKQLPSDLKVIVGETARKGTFREKIQTHAVKAITVQDLLEKIKTVPNARAKVGNMLQAGLLKRA